MKPRRILLIEPDQDICGSISQMLDDAGYITVTANDLQILHHLDTFIQVDLTIVDLDEDVTMIPIIQAWSADDRFRGRILPVICYCVDDHSARLLQSGTGPVLVKPFDLRELESAVETMMALR